MQLATTPGARRWMLTAIVLGMVLVAPVAAVSAAHSEFVGSVPL